MPGKLPATSFSWIRPKVNAPTLPNDDGRQHQKRAAALPERRRPNRSRRVSRLSLFPHGMEVPLRDHGAGRSGFLRAPTESLPIFADFLALHGEGEPHCAHIACNGRRTDLRTGDRLGYGDDCGACCAKNEPVVRQVRLVVVRCEVGVEGTQRRAPFRRLISAPPVRYFSVFQPRPSLLRTRRPVELSPSMFVPSPR